MLTPHRRGTDRGTGQGVPGWYAFVGLLLSHFASFLIALQQPSSPITLNEGFPDWLGKVTLPLSVRRTVTIRCQSLQVEHVVVAIQPACLVERGILRSEDPAQAKDNQSSGNSGGAPGIPALRRFHSLWPTPPASEALGNAGELDGNSGNVKS
jgi:hypothetical protein